MDDIEPGDTVFLLSPAVGEGEQALCSDLLDPEGVDDTSVLFVTLTDTPTDRIGFWEAHVGERPDRVSVVHTGGVGDDADDSTDVRLVRNPGNLTQFGVQITEALDELRSADGPIVVCFRSLSALLQYAGPNQAFQFMQVLTDHFKQAGALAHVHMNSDAHDSQTIATFTQVFDAVIEVEADGSRKVTT
ncbi:MAG: hypothetical protein ABEH66_06545 [Halobacteriales archaeon]